MEFNRNTIIAFPDDTDIPDITTGIVSGSLSLEEVLCSKDFSFGEFNATKFEAQIYQLSNVASKRIIVYTEENGTKTQLFTGIIDSCARDDSGYYRDIIAYDIAYTTRDTNVASWWTDFWKSNTTTTLKKFRNSLLSYMGISESTKSLYNDDLTFSKPADLDSMPFGTLISAICQLQLCFPHIDRYGKLDYIVLSTNTNTAIDITEYEGNNSTFETYATAKITRVQLYNGNDLIGIAGNDGNNYSIKDNIILTALEKAETQALAESILNQIKSLTLTPCEVKMLYSHLDYNLGDYIHINGVYSYIMSNTLSGVKLVEQTLKASADEYFTSTTEYNSSIQYTKDKTSQILETLTSDYISADVIDSKYATIESLTATNAELDDVKAKKLDAETATFTYATIESLKATNTEVDTLKATALTAAKADLAYAQIDFANVTGQVVGTSLIKDGAVTNEKVLSLSANKLTAGEIDASKIIVKNLNADNLTVGTINGKLIGSGSVDLDKLSEEVPTKEYLDQVQDELQGQIDGNIETFTVTEIPTLDNQPAVQWTDNATRKKHVGDICYVINEESSADGYSYRFANTGSLTSEGIQPQDTMYPADSLYPVPSPYYEWVLIKDSDVTKALQEIVTINGNIDDITKFDTEIASWKTDTDEELSSLKLRTTEVETSLGTKVSISTFNEVKQTVEENSASITTLTTTVGTKADNTTVEELTNTVNTVQQTADTNTASISNLTQTVNTKADINTVTDISSKVSTVEQDLNGLSVNVTNQFVHTDSLINNNNPMYIVSNIGEPTFENFPACNWNVPIYPADNFYPSDNFKWTYTDEEYEKHVGTTVRDEAKNKMWRFIRKLTDEYAWIEISETPTNYLSNQNAELKVEINEISTSLSKLSTTVTDNYTQTTQLDSYIKQLIDDSSSQISIGLTGTYTTQTALDKKLESYATTASLDLYIKEDDTGTLKSCIEAIADTINITARGGLNLSGNRFTLSSDKTTITADGSITCSNITANGGTIGAWKVSSYALWNKNDSYSVELRPSLNSNSYVFDVSKKQSDDSYLSQFNVRSDGQLYANTALFGSGGIDVSGTSRLGGWKINNYGIFNTDTAYRVRINTNLSYNSQAFEVSAKQSDGTYLTNFYVQPDGKLYTKNALIGNEITIPTATITNCYAYNYYVRSNGNWVKLEEWIKTQV